jgi:hypothetical protein
MTTPPHAHRASHYSLLGWASMLFLLPGALVSLVGIITSSYSDPFTVLAPLARLGFTLTAAGLLLMRLTVDVLRHWLPAWQTEIDEWTAKAVRHPRLVPVAQWWCAGVGTLAFAVLALAPDAIAGWFGLSSLGVPFGPLAVLVCIDVPLLIACAPLFLLYRFDRPR